MTILTNHNNISLSMAVWLAHDDYTDGAEEFPGENVISATSLLKPTRKMILEARVDPLDAPVDLVDLIPSRRGHAFHDSIEHAWKHGHARAMKKLGYPQKLIDRVRINPTDDELSPDIIPVYLEQRHFRPIMVDGHKIIISGKFDQIINGEVNDTKSTSVFTAMHGTKEEDYQIQGSIYRWINPERVTSDFMRVQYIFTDWQRSQTRINKDYPQHPIQEFTVELMSLRETESWISSKVREILSNQALEEPDILPCSDKDLWMSDPVYKYYSDPTKAAEGGRSTKNFPNYPAAAQHVAKMKGKGVIVEVKAEPKACAYCSGYSLCTQKNQYFPEE